ncbi:MAG: squalene/phytoene synthase family protein [Parasphingopyxis sp.]|nr:squalene/phytoene synthase family protein [Sphingomonadales bacterium]
MDRLSDSERELALHYAPREKRAVLRALWSLDEKMGGIVASTGEPAIGEMRLLWWREALDAIGERVPAEPLLEEIAASLGGDAAAAGQWGALAEGWHALLQAPIGEAELARFARERGARLFGLSAAILDGSIAGLEQAGAGWALVDLAANISDGALAGEAAAMAHAELQRLDIRRWPVRLRALGALVALARRDAAGDPRRRRQGAPGRVLRMVRHRLTGY